MKLGIVGCGKMAQTILRVAEEKGIEIVGMIGRGYRKDFSDISEMNGILDFSHPGNLDLVLETGRIRNIPLVIGTTGFSDDEEEKIVKTSGQIPVVFTGNYSTGVTVLLRLVREVAEVIPDFDVEIVEAHHKMKADSPSGTAKAIRNAIDSKKEKAVLYGREGKTGKRGNEIGMHSLRGGTVAGLHSVYFLGDHETLELTHRAEDRTIFANGAIRAMEYALNAKAGLYDMEDVLFGGK